MNMTDHERPGVYSSYDASAIVSGSGAGKTVGLVAVGTCEEMGTVVPISRQEEAVAAFGAGTALTELVRLLLLNGAAATVDQEWREQAYQRAAEILYLEDPVGCYLNSRNEIVCLSAQVEDFNMTPVGIYDWPSIRVRAD